MKIEEGFQQNPLTLTRAYSDDPALRALLERTLPASIFNEIELEFEAFERRLAGPIRRWALPIDSMPASIEPTLTQYDQWGQRIDTLETSESWRQLKQVAIEEGLVAISFERKEGEFSRTRAFAKAYLFAPEGLYVGCPISMTDGAARVLELAGTQQMKENILPKLTSWNPQEAFIAGQWMTERTGGSDVSLTETVARPEDPARTSPGDWFVLDGFKWFSSATDGHVALALARTGEPAAGSKGLSLFLIELRDEAGRTNGVHIHRLKKKFGTKALPTAELSVANCRARLVGPLGSGVRTISTVLNITRLHSSLSCVASLRRGLVIAKAFAKVRHIAGGTNQLLANNAMHTNALVKAELTHRATLHLVFGAIRLLGRSEVLGEQFGEEEKSRLRLLTPVVKSFAAEICTTELPDLMASLGGQGYMVENQFARIIADANVERIWEGTTSVLSLDVVRVIIQTKGQAVRDFVAWSRSVLADASHLAAAVEKSEARLQLLERTAQSYLEPERRKGPEPRMSRPLLFLLGYIASTTYLIEQATWSTNKGRHEADLDRWLVSQWIEIGGSRDIETSLERLLSESDGKNDMARERALVYGLERGSKM
ncbi:uncharacterized protein JCM15063_004681 [Sporobolomyces koalae]|uniref:uncharacterized protein n=1 Tax=Sporobolomyces koalae TaxID=500713 RepID=UPI003174550A